MCETLIFIIFYCTFVCSRPQNWKEIYPCLHHLAGDASLAMTANIETNNRRIARNTIALSARMIITIAIGVYSSRLVLDAMGVSDYGIYNVVGGIVSFFLFVNASLVSASQRFLNYYMGVGDADALQRVFSTSLCLFAVLAMLVVVLSETVGVWMVNSVLHIPAHRVVAANVVCQLTILSAVIDILSLPYNALIVAYERMTVFAYVAVVQSVCSLGAAFALVNFGGDRMILYAVLLCLIQVAVRVFYGYYCARNFPLHTGRIRIDKPLMTEMMNFSGWGLFGTLAYFVYTQGIPMLYNLFFGPVVNAANALAQQVNASLSTFGANFMMAARPQITKYYAEGELGAMRQLVFTSSKLSVLIMLMVSLPFIVMPDYLLGLWLVEVPAHTAMLLRMVMWATVVNALSFPVTAAIQATGRVRTFQVAEAACLLLIIPVVYVVFRLGAAPEAAYAVLASVFVLAQVVRVWFLLSQLGVALWDYVRSVVIQSGVLSLLSLLVVMAVHRWVGDTLWGVGAVLLAVLVLVPAIYVVACMTHIERIEAYCYVRNKFRKECRR